MTEHIEQPTPTRNDRPPVQDQVIADIAARTKVGVRRYGTPLQPFNGRSALRDLYEELLDAAQYAKQLLLEDAERERLLRERLSGLLTSEAAIREGVGASGIARLVNAVTYGLFDDRGPQSAAQDAPGRPESTWHLESWAPEMAWVYVDAVPPGKTLGRTVAFGRVRDLQPGTLSRLIPRGWSVLQRPCHQEPRVYGSRWDEPPSDVVALRVESFDRRAGDPLYLMRDDLRGWTWHSECLTPRTAGLPRMPWSDLPAMTGSLYEVPSDGMAYNPF